MQLFTPVLNDYILVFKKNVIINHFDFPLFDSVVYPNVSDAMRQWRHFSNFDVMRRSLIFSKLKSKL